jgi:hypothetical protein
MNEDFDSRLSSLLDGHFKQREQAATAATDAEGKVQKFFNAWNVHRVELVEPALKKVAEALRGRSIAATVDLVPTYRVVPGAQGNARVAPETSGIALSIPTREVIRRLSFQPTTYEKIVIEYPQYHREESGLSDVTRELVQERALSFVREFLGGG